MAENQLYSIVNGQFLTEDINLAAYLMGVAGYLDMYIEYIPTGKPAIRPGLPPRARGIFTFRFENQETIENAALLWESRDATVVLIKNVISVREGLFARLRNRIS